MKVRNTCKAPIQFMVRMNPGEMVEIETEHGTKISKPAKPELTHIYIPAEAEVELDDDLWTRLTKSKTTAKEFTTEFEEYPGLKEKGSKYRRPVRTSTGRTIEINLVKERIKIGDLVVTEKPKAAKTIKEMVADLAAVKVVVTSETHTQEEVEKLHMMLCE